MPFVSTYEVKRCYGGPEEGGWWYDHWTYVQTIFVDDLDAAEKLCERIREHIRRNERTPQAISERILADAQRCEALPDTKTYADTEGDIPLGWSLEGRLRAVVEDRPKDNETIGRPHYE